MPNFENLSENDRAVLNSIFNPNLPLRESSVDDDLEFDDDRSSNTTVANLEVRAVAEAENGELDNSLETLQAALKLEPNRAALYNNRAQVFMLQSKLDAAFEDLNKAIMLSEGRKTRTLSLSHCQRGVIHRRRGNDELAKADFSVAAQLGNAFAKQQLVEMNPYAALCNQMLSQVMKECDKS